MATNFLSCRKKMKQTTTPRNGAPRAAKKRQPQEMPMKVGRIKASVARIAGISPGNIFISSELLQRMEEEDKVGWLSPSLLVGCIFTGYNQIRQFSADTLLLVDFEYKGRLTKVATMEIRYLPQKGIWEVVSVKPKSKTMLAKMKLLYENIREIDLF